VLKAGPLFNNQLHGQLRLITVASGNFPLELLVVERGKTEVRGGRKNTKNMEGYRGVGGGGAGNLIKVFSHG
jgi:hypothetical protein